MHALTLWALLFVTSPTKAAPQLPAGTFHLERDAKGIRCIKVATAGGDVRIRGHRGGQVVVDGARSLGGSSCKVKLAGSAATLEINATDASGRPCLVDLQIKVPQTADLKLRNGTGNLFVSGVRAALELDIAQGNAVVGGVFSKFVGHLAEGSLSVQGLAGDGQVTIERGNVQMYLAPEASERKVALDFHVGTGNVTLTSPGKTANVQLTCSAGQLQNDLDDGGATSNLVVTGEIGRGNFVARPGS